ncbi:hypothetical protein MNV49_004293 [Pseudohyphozyma bogoriensis]|nr:hypothetical protein MNV49_004293 [Pseudohyphozyma bogoriensis]
MEDLRGIGQSLPPSTDQAEKDLSASFKVAAASLAGLFKVGRRATQQAFRAGKREALQDVLEFIQASLDHPAATAHGGSSAAGSATAPSGNVTARLIDYLEARQLTLQAEEDDEDESENPPRSAPAPAPTAQDLGQALLVGNMKRRWGTVSMAEVDLDGANPVVEVGSPEGSS